MGNLKKYVLAGALVLVSCMARAATVKYSQALVNESGVAVSKTAVLPLNNVKVDQVAAQVSWSTPTIPSVPFTDGSTSKFTITVASSPIGGIANETICINGTCIADGNGWTRDPGGKSSGTACGIAAGINASSVLSTIVVSTCVASTSVVATTSTATGSGVNYATYSSSQSALTLSPFTSSSPVTSMGFGSMTGGTASAFAINTTVIFATSTFSPTGKTPMVGLPVLYRSLTAGASIGGLTTGTTYYLIPVTPTSFGLAATSTGAVAGYNALPSVSTTSAGSFLLLTSSRTLVTPDNFTLDVASTTAITSLRWMVSNDGATFTPYVNSSTGTITFQPLSLSTSTAYDFGFLNFSYLQAEINRTGPTAPWSGPVQLLITINGKNSGL